MCTYLLSAPWLSASCCNFLPSIEAVPCVRPIRFGVGSPIKTRWTLRSSIVDACGVTATAKDAPLTITVITTLHRTTRYLSGVFCRIRNDNCHRKRSPKFQVRGMARSIANGTFSPPPLSSTASQSNGATAKLNIVSRLAIDGKAKQSSEGAHVHLYLKVRRILFLYLVDILKSTWFPAVEYCP